MKKHLKFVYGIVSVFIFGLVTCPVMGQGLIQKPLSSDDYKLWSKLYSNNISDKGNWISYTLRYESHKDTLFVKNVISDKKYFFPKCYNPEFSAEKVFGCLDANKNLNVLDLQSGQSFLTPNVTSYEFSSDGQFIISLELTTDKTSNLYVRNIKGQLVNFIENVTEYKMNSLANTLLYVSSIEGSSNIGQINFSKKIAFKTILKDLPSKVQNLTWSKDQSTFAFYGLSDTWQLYHYQFNTKKLAILKDLPSSEYGSQVIVPDNGIRLKISDDNSVVFFSFKSTEEPEIEKPVVEIWNAADKLLYLQNELVKSYNKPFLALWYPQTQKTKPINSRQFPWVSLTGNQKFAILADPLQYEPQYKDFADVDYFIMDLRTGKKELLIEKVSSHPSNIGTSPEGRFVNYYKNHDWWIYDIDAKTHTNITDGLSAEFDNRKVDPDPQLYGFEGWGAEGKTVLIYDQFDVWEISVDGKIRSRLTNGKEQKIRFRLVDLNKINKSSFNYSGLQTSIYDKSKSLILSAESMLNADSGYFIMNQKKLKPLVFKQKKVSNFLKARKKDVYIFTEQSFTNSPSIILKSSPQAAIKTIVKTNDQQQHFYWGFSEMIHYSNSKNIPLNGALFYPANYDASIKYPMVVYIYSKTSPKIHEYVNPTNHNNFGFNITTLTANGYFVLLADIDYQKGNPGISAVDCVTNAVKSVTERGLVDPHKIGLLGHSFGGYETFFIITQSNLFATAVSGAGVSDIIRTYFTISDENQRPEVWRYENQQFRMVSSFYQDKDSYFRNCPILHADNINTPLLTWAGKNDVTVNTEQSTAIYIALRRLGKKHIMLQYPNEEHILSSAASQEDLSIKTLEWFDFYLKKNSPANWISNSN